MPEPEIRMWDRIKPWVYMAAMFVGLMFTVRAFVNENRGRLCRKKLQGKIRKKKNHQKEKDITGSVKRANHNKGSMINPTNNKYNEYIFFYFDLALIINFSKNLIWSAK